MMSEPFFSIIIPCFNQGHFLNECLLSVVEQTYPKWEIIIINDGSTDDTKIISEHWSNSDLRVKYFQKKNGGLSSARNLGIKYSNGVYLSFLDADDRFTSKCLEKVQARIIKEETNDIVQTGYNYIEDNTGTIIHTVYPSFRKRLMPDILTSNIGPVHSFFIKRTVLRTTGLFDEGLKSVEDWDFWIRVAKAGADSLGITSEALVDYRITADSMSRNAVRMYAALKEVAFRAIKKDDRLTGDCPFNKDYDLDPFPGIKRSLLTCLGVNVMQGKIEESVALFIRETTQYDFVYNAEDFSAMCSYLSFRYKSKSQDFSLIFDNYYPRFQLFFKELPLPEGLKDKALQKVFRMPRMLRNRKRFGVFGRLFNRFFV